jgi:DNA-binding IclR family transcriptional regulator
MVGRFHDMKVRAEPFGIRDRRCDQTEPNVATAEVNNLHVSRSAERALSLLDLIATEGSLPLGAAAKATDIPVSTALRHLRALVGSGWLQREQSGEYTAGPNLLRVAVRVFQAGPYAQLIALAQPYLNQLADSVGESVYLGVRDGDVAVYLAMAESTRSIRHVGWVGKEVPLEGTAIGAALQSEPDRAGPLEVFTASGVVEPDVAAVSVPIVDRTSRSVLAAFSVLGPRSRLAEETSDAARALRQATAGLSADLDGAARQ